MLMQTGLKILIYEDFDDYDDVDEEAFDPNFMSEIKHNPQIAKEQTKERARKVSEKPATHKAEPAKEHDKDARTAILCGAFGVIMALMSLGVGLHAHTKISALATQNAQLRDTIETMSASSPAPQSSASRFELSISDRQDIVNSVVAELGGSINTKTDSSKTVDAAMKSAIDKAVDDAFKDMQDTLNATKKEIDEKVDALNEDTIGDIRFIRGASTVAVPESAKSSASGLTTTYIGTADGNLLRQFNFGSDGYWINQVVANIIDAPTSYNMEMTDAEIDMLEDGTYGNRVLVKVEQTSESGQSVSINGKNRVLKSAEVVMPSDGKFILGEDGTYANGHSEYDTKYAFVIFNFTDGRSFYVVPAATAANIGRFFYPTYKANGDLYVADASKFTDDEMGKIRSLLTENSFTNDEIALLKQVAESYNGKPFTVDEMNRARNTLVSEPLTENEIKILRKIVESVGEDTLSRTEYNTLRDIIGSTSGYPLTKDEVNLLRQMLAGYVRDSYRMSQ